MRQREQKQQDEDDRQSNIIILNVNGPNILI